jgi:hypothetical protein
MIEFTEWAKEILERSVVAARRFNPSASVRLARVGDAVQAVLTDSPDPGDVRIDLGATEVYVQSGLEGVVDVEEPHDRVVLRPAGSKPNERGH